MDVQANLYIILIFNLITLLADSADEKLMIFLPENRL